MPYRPSTVTRDPEVPRARPIEETSPAWYNLEVLSSDRPRATSSRLRTSWLKLASGSRDGHRRHAGLNGEGRTRAPSLCGIVVSYLWLGPELYGLPGACMCQAVVSIIIKKCRKTPILTLTSSTVTPSAQIARATDRLFDPHTHPENAGDRPTPGSSAILHS